MAEPRDLVIRTRASTHRVRLVSAGAVEVDGRRVPVDVSSTDGSTFLVAVGAARYTVLVVADGARAWAMAAGETFEVERASPGPAAVPPTDLAPALRAGFHETALSAPMPATVTAVLVGPGDRVAEGQPIIRLEAMKMELLVSAPRSGHVATIHCRQGDLVLPGRPLLTLRRELRRAGSDAPVRE